MSPPIWAALILAGLGAVWLLLRLPPRRALAAVALAAAAGLALLRLFPLALPVAAAGIALWRSQGALPTPGRQSEVESPALRMTLDHDSGRMDGEVTAGPFQGAFLSELSAENLDLLRAGFEADGDDDSLALLLAWLERQGRRPDSTATGTEDREDPARPPVDPGNMTEPEAWRILGLAPGASLAEVRAAHARLIRRVHPDLGGTSGLAALINAARDRLDPG